MTEIRYFNTKGRKIWSDWLEALRVDTSCPIPDDLLTDKQLSRPAPGGRPCPTVFNNKFELAEAIAKQVTHVEEKGLEAEHWPGLWDWLAARYFDEICPPKADGSRAVKALPLYRLENDFRRSYRHRIYGPVTRVRRLGEHAKILLHGSPHTLTDWEEQASARFETGGNPGIAEAMCRLYWDEDEGKPKKGAAPNKKTPGTLRRFSDIIKQFSLNYDLSAIDTDGLLELLPPEFDKWKPQDEE